MADLICIVAGELSGDNLAAALIRELQLRRPQLRFAGIAGPAMMAAGCAAWDDSENLAVMGLFEVIGHLPRLLAVRRRFLGRARAEGVRLFVGVDAPDFNLTLAGPLRALGIPTVQYVSPTVWAWRQGRVHKMARILDLVLCLLPFESAFYAKAGLAAEFVGHPLADSMPRRPDRAAARAALGLDPDRTVLAILPGSRRGEVERLAGDFFAAALWLRERRPDIQCVVPLANATARELVTRELTGRDGLDVTLSDGNAQQALAAADIALVASGTATLETLLCKRPMVVAYKTGAATAWIVRRMVKVSYFSYPNLLAGRALVPELFQEQVTPERMGAELLAWLEDPARVAAAVSEFDRIHGELARHAAERAAESVLALLDRGRAP
jgi:lipid-A-disaccharide synthase